MKIIGKTENSFLVEITEEEIAACCGFRSTYGDEWEAFVKKHGKLDSYRNAKLDVGCEFHPKQISDWHYNVQYKRRQVEEAAGFLTALAEMMRHPPDAFTIPPSDAEKAAAMAVGEEEDK